MSCSCQSRFSPALSKKRLSKLTNLNQGIFKPRSRRTNPGIHIYIYNIDKYTHCIHKKSIDIMNLSALAVASFQSFLRLMVSWQSGFLNDCEFVESVVQGQIVGQTTWFRPTGCQNLTLLNSYHCTAEGLTPDTQYIFRVQTNCSDPQSSSPWSVSSLPESTLATVQEWESNQRRLLAINIVSDVDYNQVVSNVEAFKSSIASQTALSLGVDASKVKVEIMAGEATSASRRLAALSTVFTVTVEGATQDESHTSNEVVAGVASTVQQKTGSTSTLSVASTSSLTPAIAPQKITWSETGDGRLKLHWNPLPLGNCSFLAWHVLANAGGSNTPVAGCTSLTNLSHTDCSAVGLDGSKSNTFTVAVLCANPAANSAFSLASDAWQTVSTTSTQNPMLTLLTTGEPTTPSTSQTTTPCTMPPVELTSPWTASQRISQQVGETESESVNFSFKLMSLMSISICDQWVFHWSFPRSQASQVLWLPKLAMLGVRLG